MFDGQGLSQVFDKYMQLRSAFVYDWAISHSTENMQYTAWVREATVKLLLPRLCDFNSYELVWTELLYRVYKDNKVYYYFENLSLTIKED